VTARPTWRRLDRGLFILTRSVFGRESLVRRLDWEQSVDGESVG
jgi:hypothetical protein